MFCAKLAYPQIADLPEAATPWGGAVQPDVNGSCPAGDPCVLTGQYNRQRTSANVTASNAGGMAASSALDNFGLAYLYPVKHSPAGRGNEPVVAQPLYITRVPVQNVPSSFCSGTGLCNMLLVGTLSDWVYAFDTSTAPTPTKPNYLWPPINLATAPGHCSSLTGGPDIGRSARRRW